MFVTCAISVTSAGWAFRFYPGEEVDIPNCAVFGKPQTLRGTIVNVVRAPTFKFDKSFEKLGKYVNVMQPSGAPSGGGEAEGSSENAAYEVEVIPKKRNLDPKVQVYSAGAIRRRRKDGFNKEMVKVRSRIWMVGCILDLAHACGV